MRVVPARCVGGAARAQAAARIKAALYSLLIVIAIAILGDESECRLINLRFVRCLIIFEIKEDYFCTFPYAAATHEWPLQVGSRSVGT